MADGHDSFRRTVVLALASSPLLTLAGTESRDDNAERSGSRTLVAYFSRSGNIRVVAGLIQRGLNADLFEIRPALPYPEDYLQTVEQARRERDGGYAPGLERTIKNLASYDRLFLGFPIWGETLPPVIRAFLSAHDLNGKTIVPFTTHGGYGLGDSRAVLTRHAPKSRILEGFVMEGEQERRTMENVNEWLSDQQFAQ